MVGAIRRRISGDLSRFRLSAKAVGRVRPRFIRPVCRFRLHLRNAFGRRHPKMITARKGSRNGEETLEKKSKNICYKTIKLPLDKTESVPPAI